MTQEFPIPMITMIRDNFPYYAKHHVLGFTTQGRTSAYLTSGLNYYLRHKLMWDAGADVDAILDDYFIGMYGPAAGAVRDYVMRLQRMVDECDIHFTKEDELLRYMYPLKKLEEMSSLVERAEKAVANADKRYAHRVPMWVLGHQMMLAHQRMIQATLKADFHKAIEQADLVIALRERMKETNPTWAARRRYFKRSWHVEQRRNLYKQFIAKMEGPNGKLVTWLPRRWYFRWDRNGIGMIDGWPSETPSEPGWQLRETDILWQREFADFQGSCWYKTWFNLDKSSATKDLQLQFTAVFGDMWVFLNGRLVVYRRPFTGWNRNWDWPYECTLPARFLGPGKNLLTVKMTNGYISSGQFKRAFIYLQAVQPDD